MSINPDMLPGGCAAMTTGSMETRIVAGVVLEAGVTMIHGSDAVAFHVTHLVRRRWWHENRLRRRGTDGAVGCRAAPKN